jgi:signal transduction histidine kinase
MDLRPSILDDLGLMQTIGWLCRQFQSIYSAIDVECVIGVQEGDVPEPLKIVVFRIMQEALNNIAKYSKADRVALSLRKRDNILELVIRDNGVGFDLEAACRGRIGNGGMGLTSMRERAEFSGGVFRIDSAVGRGTLIRVSWGPEAGCPALAPPSAR